MSKPAVKSKNPPEKVASANGTSSPDARPRIAFGQFRDRLAMVPSIHAQSPIRVQVRVRDFLMGESYLTLGVTDIKITPSDKGKPDLVEFFVG